MVGGEIGGHIAIKRFMIVKKGVWLWTWYIYKLILQRLTNKFL